MIDAKTKKTIREAVVADRITFKSDGTVVFKDSYFYRSGRTAEGFGERVKKDLTKIGMTPSAIKTRDAWAAWPKDSYFIAEVRL